jgi:hypothetical protein
MPNNFSNWNRPGTNFYFALNPQLVLPGVIDPEDDLVWMLQPKFYVHYITFSLCTELQEPIDVPVDGPEENVAKVMEARLEGGYKWQQLMLPCSG